MTECPHIVRKQYGDESMDYCELTGRPSGRIQVCLLVGGESCKTWNELQKEWEAEEDHYAEALAEDYGSGGNTEE